MILISRRKTSPGTSPIREAVNKVTCSCTRPNGSFGRGPGEAGRAAQGSLAPPGRARQGSGTLCLLSSGWRPCPRVGLRSLAFLFPSLMLFFWGTPRTSELCFSSPSKWRVPFLVCPQALPQSPKPQVPHCSPSNPSSFRARLLHPPSWTWVGEITQRGLLEATC